MPDWNVAVKPPTWGKSQGEAEPNMDATDSLIEKIRALPAERVAEVEDFVDFLSRKVQRQAAAQRLLSIAPALEAAGLPPPSEAEIEREAKTARRSRRGNPMSAGSAGRS